MDAMIFYANLHINKSIARRITRYRLSIIIYRIAYCFFNSKGQKTKSANGVPGY